VLVAGHGTAANSAQISAVAGGGMEAIDAGGLSRARQRQAIAFLQLILAATEKIG
jgi:predicted dinucleotide-binding enzyme